MQSYLSLHLNCRLWISELNADINALRIYTDYLDALRAASESADLSAEIQRLSGTFPSFRKNIDDIRNDLHLVKMQLGIYIRDRKTVNAQDLHETNYNSVHKRFVAFKREFGELQKELRSIEPHP